MPAIADYLAPGEDVVVSTTAADTEDRSETDREGVIACSKERVVFSRDRYVADISLRSVNSIEYRPPSPDKRLINGGLVGLGVAAIGWIARNEPLLDIQSLEIIIGMISLLGVGAIVAGLLNTRSVLKIHTPSKSYTFNSDKPNLENVAHAIRTHEP